MTAESSDYYETAAIRAQLLLTSLQEAIENMQSQVAAQAQTIDVLRQRIAELEREKIDALISRRR